jgi:hypothetical protein
MPASLYRLAGKPHPTETINKVVEQTTVEETQVVEQVVVQTEVPQDVVEAVESVVAQVETPVETVVETVVEAPKLVWDSSWSRTKLYQFAVDNKVVVTNAMTKNQIIDTLTAANSAT